MLGVWYAACCGIRSPYLWRDPDEFRPERFSEKFANPDFGGKWAGEARDGSRA